jgi:signal transduction histidine kinase
MNRFKIGPRLTFSFIVIFALMFLGSSVSLWQYRAVLLQAERLQQVDRQAMAVLSVQNRVLMIKETLRESIALEDPICFASDAKSLKKALDEDIDRAIEALEATEADKVQSVASIVQLKALKGRLPEQIDAMIKLAEAGDWVSLRLRLDAQVERAEDDARNVVARIDRHVHGVREDVIGRMASAQTQATSAITGTSLLALVAVAVLGFTVTRSIYQPLTRLNAGAKALAAGDFEHRIHVAGDDELANVSHAFNDTAAQLAELYGHLEDLVQQRTEELRYRALQLETSIEVAQTITSILDLDVLLNRVAETVKNRYGYAYVGISLLDEQKDSYLVVTHAGAQSPFSSIGSAEGRRMLTGHDPLMDKVIRTREPLLINEAVPPDTERSMLSRLILPLQMGQQLLGMLDIQTNGTRPCAHPERFREEDVPVLQLLSNEIAIAIHNASLYESERSRRQLAETLYNVGRALSGTLDLSEVLDLILAYLADIVPYHRGAVLLSQGEILAFVAARGFPPTVDPLTLQIAIETNDVYQTICASQAPLAIVDVAQRADWQRTEGIPNPGSWLGVPLIRANEVIGMLSLARETVEPYTEDETTLASALAGQAAIAIENARLYERVTRFNRELEQRVEERTRELQAAYEKLERLDRNKSDFIAVASHELRTPLTPLRAYSQILLKDKLIQDSEFHHRAIQGIHSGTMRLYEIVNTMLDMVKIENQALELYPEPVSLGDLVRNVAHTFGDAIVERQQTLIIESMQALPDIKADGQALKKVFHHLIMNAIKYTPDGGTLTISGRNCPEGCHAFDVPCVEIVVQDTGIGIDPAYHTLIFEKFYQTGEVSLHSSGRTRFKAGGPGLGLAIAQGIIEAHGGRIWVESPGCSEETCPGSRFYVVLPVGALQ